MRPNTTVLLLAATLGLGSSCKREDSAAARVAAGYAREARELAAQGKLDQALVAALFATEYEPLEPSHRDLLWQLRFEALATSPESVGVEQPLQWEYQAGQLAQRDGTRAHVYQTALGYLALTRKDQALAESHFREALRIRQGWVPPMLGLARLLSAQATKAEEAERLFVAVLEAEPKNAAALAGYGGLLLERRPEQAAKLLARAVEVADRAPTRLLLASALSASGKAEEAGGHLERATRLQPGNGEAFRRLGEWFLTYGKLHEAEAAFGEASRLGAEPLATFGLGLVDLREGRGAQAAKRFEAVASSDARLFEAEYQAGRAFELAGDLPNAKRAFERYLRAAGDSVAHQAQVQDVQSRLARYAATPPPPEDAGRKEPAARRR